MLVILGRGAAGRKAARAEEAVLLALFLRQRRTEQCILIAQQLHPAEDGPCAVHIGGHGLTHGTARPGVVLNGQILHGELFPAEKGGVAAEGVGGPAIRVGQPAAVPPHDAGLIRACADQCNILLFADQLFPVNARPDADDRRAGVGHGQHRLGHRGKIAAAIGRHCNVEHFYRLLFLHSYLHSIPSLRSKINEKQDISRIFPAAAPPP